MVETGAGLVKLEEGDKNSEGRIERAWSQRDEDVD